MEINSSGNDVLLKLNNLKKVYNDKVAVENISLDLFPNEVVALLGPNGSGKTTTLKCILGLTKPTNGDVYLKDSSKIASVLSTEALHPGRSGYDTVRDIAAMKNKRKEDIKRVLEFVGLTISESRKKVSSYSTGMKQRILIACAIVLDPDILILDEPEIGLDPDGQEWLMIFFKQFIGNGKAILLSTHNFYTVATSATRVLFCGDGKILGSLNIADLNITVEELNKKYRECTHGYGRDKAMGR